MIRLRPRTHHGLCVALPLLLMLGCDQKESGPKRPGYKEATIAHYHPDVRPRQPATAPATAPVPFDFGQPGVGSPVMVVNGEPITVSQVLEPIYDDLLAKSRTLSETAYRDYLIQRILDQVSTEVRNAVIYQEAKKTIPDKMDEAFAKEADKVLQNIINNRFGGVKARYEARLKAMDLSYPEAKERIKRQIMVDEFLSGKFRPMVQSPSRAELLRYYQEHEADYTSEPKAELFLIEIPIEIVLNKPRSAATSEEIAEARRQALSLLARAREELESGIPFADVARQYSKGLQAGRGGAVGEIRPGALTERWAKAAEVLFTLEEGAVSQPVSTEDAAFLIKCGHKTPVHKASFEECQKDIKEKLMDQRFRELLRKYLLELEAKSTVQRHDEFMMAVFNASPRPPRFESASRRPLTSQ